MGLFGKKIKRPVQGYAEIIERDRSRDSDNTQALSCGMKLRLDVAGIEPRIVEHRAWFGSDSRWPEVGMRVPVTVDAEHPDRIDVDWESVFGKVRGGKFGVAAEMLADAAGVEVDLSTGPPRKDGELEGEELQAKMMRLSQALQSGAITYDEYAAAVQRATGMSG